jgi:hypothetical protein
MRAFFTPTRLQSDTVGRGSRLSLPLFCLTAAMYAPPAWAVDVDEDGAQPPFDCRDDDASIQPNEQEDPGNRVDEDCDGVDAGRRSISVSSFPAGPWSDTGVVTRQGGDTVKVGNAPQQQAGSTWRDLMVPVPRGRIHATIDVESVTGQGCKAVFISGRTGTADIVVDYPITQAGTVETGALALHGVAPNSTRVLKTVKFVCAAGSHATFDWFTILNFPFVLPPMIDIVWTWKDLEMPGGGFSPTVVRSGSDADSDGYEEIYAASDLGGIARWDVAEWDWVTINGEGATGLTTQADLGVWDVLPTVDGLYALTGRVMEADAEWSGFALAGGLWYLPNGSAAWSRLVSTREVDPFYASTEEDDFYGVGGNGRAGGCLDADWLPARTYGGGALLQAEEDGSLIYIANGDEDHLGVALWDGGEACALPNGGTALPQSDLAWTASTSDTTLADAGYVRALARMEADDGTPVLLVGYSGRIDADQALYVCALPDGDADGIADGFDCAAGTTTCSEVDTSLISRAIDVKDIEVRRELAYTNQALVASAGHYTDTAMDCQDDRDAIFVVEVLGTGGGGVAASIIGEVYTGFRDDWSTGVDLTGIAIDTDVDASSNIVDRYLYAFTPVTSDQPYDRDRIYRMDLSGSLDGCDGSSGDLPDCYDLANGYDDDGDSATDEDASSGTYPWVEVNGSSTDSDSDGYPDDEVSRESALWNAALETTWLTAAQMSEPDRHPARWAPGESIDGIFIPFYAALEDSAPGGRDLAMLASVYTLWGVFDLDMPTSLGWDPDVDPGWIIGPVANASNTRTFQETVVSDIAQDSEGNVWVPVWDLGLLVQPDMDGYVSSASQEPMERDCLWDSINAGGGSVSIVPTTTGGEAVWVSFFDQGSSVPQEMGIWKTLDHGGMWEYQAAGIPDNAVRDDADPTAYTCKEEPQPCIYCASPLGSSGQEFNDTGDPTSTEVASWGNPRSISALDENVAIVVFSSYTDGALSSDGRLALTLDGGGNWEEVTFDGGSATCDAATFFEHPKRAHLIRRGSPGYSEANDADSSGILDDGEWQIQVLLSSRYGPGGDCALARVTVSGATGALDAVWDWYTLDDTGACQVDGDNISGAVPSPGSDDAYLWGKYEHFRSSSGTYTPNQEHTGGACVIDLTDVTAPSTLTNLIDASTHRYNIADIAPHPTVTPDLLAVAPQLDAAAWFECMEVRDDGTASVGCPDVPEPLLLEWNGASWDESSVHGDLPPSLVGTTIAWGEKETKLFYGTEGAGAWRTHATW